MAKDNPSRGPRIRLAAVGAWAPGLPALPALDLGLWRARLARCLDREVEQRRLFP